MLTDVTKFVSVSRAVAPECNRVVVLAQWRVQVVLVALAVCVPVGLV